MEVTGNIVHYTVHMCTIQEGQGRQSGTCRQPRAPPRADAGPLFDHSLAPIGHHQAVLAEILAVCREAGLPAVAMWGLPFLARLPWPVEVVDHPMLGLQGRRAAVLEPIMSHQLIQK